MQPSFRAAHPHYTVRGSDLDHTLRLQVIATNAAGDSDPATSDPTGVVSNPPG